MLKRAFPFSLAAAAVCVVALNAGQTPPPAQTPPPPATPQTAAPAPQQAPPVFRGGVEIVHLDVSVLDRDRKTVKGLTADDFTLLDDGKPQSITAFYPIDVPEPIAAPVAWMRDVPPDVRSNDMRETRLFVIVLDDSLIPSDATMIARSKQIVKSIVDRLGPNDLATIIMTGDNRNAQDFTTDHVRLLAVLDKFSPGLATYTFGYSGGAAAAGVAGGLTGDETFYEQAADTLRNVTDYLIAVPQRRKALIWVSPGIPLDHAASAPMQAAAGTSMEDASKVAGREAMERIVEELPEILQRAQRANVNIYTIDPSGPGGMERYITAKLSGLRGLDATTVQQIAHKQATLQLDNAETISTDTGGHAVVNTQDFDAPVAQIFSENSSYYLLGFQPVNPKSDGKLHRLEVKMNKPGLEVRARNGYYAPEPIKVSEAAKKAAVSPLATAMASLLPNPDMPMQVMVAPFVRVAMAPPPMAMPAPLPPGAKPPATDKNKKPDPKPDPKKAKLDSGATATVAVVLGVRQKAREDSQTARIVEDVELETAAFTPEGFTRGTTRQTAHIALKQGVTGDFNYEVVTWINLAPGRYELRLATYSGALEKTGSVFTDVVVPNFATEPLSLSGVAVGKSPTVASGPKGALKELLPFAPTSDREFHVGDTITMFLRAYQGGKSKPLPVPIHMKVVDARDRVVAERDDTLDPAKFDATSRGADYSVPIDVAKLPTGQYVVSFSATLGKTTVTRDVRFTMR